MTLTEICVVLVLLPSIVISKYLNTTGDIILGGLFPVHHTGEGVAECGEVQLEEGMQMLEAMLFIVDEINKNDDILPGVKLGILAFDTCDSPAYALEQSLDFIKGFIAHSNEFHEDEKEFECADGSAPQYRGGSFDRVVALIGEQSSAVTIQMATMLRLFGTPIVSYMATSPVLSNKDRFPSFFRTVPSDVNQAHAMLELIRHFNWSYVSIVYSDSEYGNHGYETLNSLAPHYGVCFSTPLRVSKERFSDSDYDKIVEKLANNSDAKVVVVFAEKPTVVLRLVESTRRLKVGNRFVWVGSHGWTVTDHHDHHLPVSSNDLESHFVLEGALAMQPLASHLEGFDEYFTSLNVDAHEKINPWFREYWDAFFRCKSKPRPSRHIDESQLEPDDTSREACAKRNAHISSEGGYKQHSCLHFVRDSVYAVAYALHNMKTDRCGGEPGLCPAMQHIENKHLIKYLQNVHFKDEHGNPFTFLNGRDGPPRYSILNFQRTGSNSYQWIIVGNYTLNEEGVPKLYLDHNAVKFRSGDQSYPSSFCTQSCTDTQIKVREHDDACCWSCVNCGPFEIRKDDFHCSACPLGFRPSLNLTVCELIPEEHIDYDNPWAITALIVATVGIMLTSAVFYIFWMNTNTPVIKASGRELSCLLLLGTLLEFSMTFVMVAPPTDTSCAVTRFFIGFCYALCYAAIVTKTNRIARIFSAGAQNVQKTKYTSPKSQLLITAALTSVEVIINCAWFLIDPPAVVHIFPTPDVRLRICQGLGDYSYLFGLAYPFVLIGVCTAYAFKTRKCPDGFNEARHLAFTNYTAIVIWLAFVPLYIASTSYAIRIVTLALSLSFSGLVQLGCLFLPKIYIVVFTPEKNTKEVVMAHNRTSSFSTSTVSPTTFSQSDVNYFRNSSSNINSIPEGEESRTIRFHPVISVVNPYDREPNKTTDQMSLNKKLVIPNRTLRQ